MSGPKILVLDIERFKGTAQVEFWTLGDYKDRRIHASDVLVWPRTICAAWQYLDERTMHFASEWDDGVEGMQDRVWDAYDQADIVVGHNIEAFDSAKLMGAWWLAGRQKPSPWKTIDTYKVAKQFHLESATLDALASQLGIQGKVGHYDVEVARRALQGSQKDQRALKRYNIGDVKVTKAVYLSLVGWQKTPPNWNLYENDEIVRCRACGSTNLQLRGEQVAIEQVYDRYQCQKCGKWGRGTKIIRRTEGIRNA